MFKSKTVIIVGAGASAEFGLPTGAAVYKQAFELSEERSPRPLTGFMFARGFHAYLADQPGKPLLTAYDVFKERVQSSVSPTIDRLAWLNTDIAEHCRAFSAWSILRQLYSEQQERFTDYDRDLFRAHHALRNRHLNPFVDGVQNWIAKCADKWLGDATDHSELDSDSVTFVTFNYDLLIEEAVAHFVTKNSRFFDTPKEILPKVFHVHGAFPALPEKLTQEYVADAQRSIKYIEDGGEPEAVRRARIRLEQAKHVISIGFDLDSKNARLLELQKYAKKLHVLNFDGNRAFDNRALSLGVPENHILRGTPSDLLGASKAAARGFFDAPELFEQPDFFDKL